MKNIHARQSRRWLGPVLFVVYCVAYLAFVLGAAFTTFRDGKPVGGLARAAVGGVNLAVVAGMLLIVGAFILALLYAMFGARAHDEPEYDGVPKDDSQ